ncbi:MAG: dicarboxylate/amino acid:cation symporter [Bacillota bacterium]
MKKIGLLGWIMIGFLAGIIVGAIFGEAATPLRFLGDILVRLLSMLVVPLVVTTLTVGVANISGIKMGRMLGKTLIFYYITGVIGLTLALVAANMFNVGAGMAIGDLVEFEYVAPPAFTEVLVNIIPRNIIDAMAQATMLQIVFFSIIFGFAMGMAGQVSEAVFNVLESASKVMFKVVQIVLYYAPIGVFGLIAWTVGNYGLSVLAPFAGLIGVVYLVAIIHVVVVYTLFLRGFTKINPFRFLAKIKAAPLFAFVTCSSAATLPVSMKAAEDTGISKTTAGFVLPIGATVNMDGTAIYQAVAAVFIANAFGISLSIGEQAIIVVTALLASIGTAGVPGAGMIMLMTVLTAVGLPLEGVALIAGVDRILDMARTAVNVLDDIVAAALVAGTEGETFVSDLYSAGKPPAA